MLLQTSEIPLFHQPHVCSKMLQFHSQLAALWIPQCETCLEKFPGMTVSVLPGNTNKMECLRCSRDTHIHKLYSSANNMNPGAVASELMVS